MTRRLLAISWEMPPLSGPRAVQVSRLLRHLVPLGWESSVICFGPRSNRYNQDRQLADALRVPAGVRIVPVRSLEERFFFRALWRVAPPIKLLPDEKWVWIRAATRCARELLAAESFSAIVSFGQPWSDHIIARRLHRATKLPWVAHFSDPWIDSPYLRGRPWQWRLWRWMEAAVVREATALVFVNRQTADRVMRKYPAEWASKVHVVPHGFDPDEVTAQTSAPSDGRLSLVHTGRFYDGIRTPEPMLRALAALASRRPLASELHVSFIGPAIPSHARLAKALGLDGVVEFTGRIPRAQSTARAITADVLLVIDAPADENLFLPSKLVDYLPLNRPILALTPERGASADLVRALGYDVVPPDDERSIAAAIERLIEGKQHGGVRVSEPHAAVAAEYDIHRTAAAFASILPRPA